VERTIWKTALDYAGYAPLGFFLHYQTWRKNVSGIVPGPLPSSGASARRFAKKMWRQTSWIAEHS